MIKWYAVYSVKQAAVNGTSIYQRPDGTEVEITAIGKIRGCPETVWPDKKDLGEVTTFIRQGCRLQRSVRV